MKKEKGSITLYVLIACIFFVIILSIVYTNVVHKKQAQEENIAQIQANYAKSLSETNSSGNGCSCNTSEILQRLEKVEKEVATLTTENTQKSNLINDLTTRLAKAESDVKSLNDIYKISTSTTCAQLMENAKVGLKVHNDCEKEPTYGDGIILSYSSYWNKVNIIIADENTAKTYLWSVDCSNRNALVKDCITITPLN